MTITTAGLVRLSAALFVVAGALFATGFVVAGDRSTQSGEERPVADTAPLPSSAPTTPPDVVRVDQDEGEPAGEPHTSGPTPTVVETRLVTVTAPPVTLPVTVPASSAPAQDDRADPEPTSTDRGPSETTPPTTSPGPHPEPTDGPTGRPTASPTDDSQPGGAERQPGSEPTP